MPSSMDDIASYFHSVVETIRSSDIVSPVEIEAADVGERVFERISRKPYCYLSKRHSAGYRENFVEHANKFAASGEPIRLFYDIGAGYHASLEPGTESLSFSPSLGELFMLHQIARFDSEVKAFYSPGVRFTFVIDNLLARFVNDIPVEFTAGYCSTLRALIEELGMDDRVDLLVESEICDEADYAAMVEERPDEHVNGFQISEAEQRNVSRFLGYCCERYEAIERMARYRKVTPVSDRVLNAQIDSVRMTQRATPATIAFRPFPGGDSRIQAGEVMLCRNQHGKVRPVLLTCENVSNYDCALVSDLQNIPSSLPGIRIAAARSSSST